MAKLSPEPKVASQNAVYVVGALAVTWCASFYGVLWIGAVATVLSVRLYGHFFGDTEFQRGELSQVLYRVSLYLGIAVVPIAPWACLRLLKPHDEFSHVRRKRMVWLIVTVPAVLAGILWAVVIQMFGAPEALSVHEPGGSCRGDHGDNRGIRPAHLVRHRSGDTGLQH